VKINRCWAAVSGRFFGVPARDSFSRIVKLIAIAVVLQLIASDGKTAAPNSHLRAETVFAPRAFVHVSKSSAPLDSEIGSERAAQTQAARSSRAKEIRSSSVAAQAPAPTPTFNRNGLNIRPVFDISITTNPNAAAIEAAINRAIAIYQTLFTDRISVAILFRYSATGPEGGTLDGIAQSNFVVYPPPWNVYIDALKADGRTSNDFLANAILPSNPLSANIVISSANGRAVGLGTSPAMYANATVASGGPFDGIVTLKSSVPWQFTRPAVAGRYDAQRSIEHEINEVLGFGSFIGRGTDLRPQDLFSWINIGVRNITTNGGRVFSIDRWESSVAFNQESRGDYGDWASDPCPQVNPFVQNAFACSGDFSDISFTSYQAHNLSFEGQNLDVIGYDLNVGPYSPKCDFNGDKKDDYVLYNESTGQTAVWYMNNNVGIGGGFGPTITAGWKLIAVADFNRDGHPDYFVVNPSTGQTAIWYLSGLTLIGAAYGPSLPPGWQVTGAGDLNNDGYPDLVLYNLNPFSSSRALWYMNNNVRIGYTTGEPVAWYEIFVGLADMDRDGYLDYILAYSYNGQGYLTEYENNRSGGQGPTIPDGGFQLVGIADFNRDGYPDYLLFNPNTLETVIWYLDSHARHVIGGASGPSLPPGWSLVAPK
jgi:FG-GAP-like repeat